MNENKYKKIKDKLIEYANIDDDIKAVIAIGSSTREENYEYPDGSAECARNYLNRIDKVI